MFVAATFSVPFSNRLNRVSILSRGSAASLPRARAGRAETRSLRVLSAADGLLSEGSACSGSPPRPAPALPASAACGAGSAGAASAARPPAGGGLGGGRRSSAASSAAGAAAAPSAARLARTRPAALGCIAAGGDDDRGRRIDLEDPEAQHAVGDLERVVEVVEHAGLGYEAVEAVVGLVALADLVRHLPHAPVVGVLELAGRTRSACGPRPRSPRGARPGPPDRASARVRIHVPKRRLTLAVARDDPARGANPAPRRLIRSCGAAGSDGRTSRASAPAPPAVAAAIAIAPSACSPARATRAAARRRPRGRIAAGVAPGRDGRDSDGACTAPAGRQAPGAGSEANDLTAREQEAKHHDDGGARGGGRAAAQLRSRRAVTARPTPPPPAPPVTAAGSGSAPGAPPPPPPPPAPERPRRRVRALMLLLLPLDFPAVRAGEPSTLPPGSMARTEQLCLPVLTLILSGELQAETARRRASTGTSTAARTS